MSNLRLGWCALLGLLLMATATARIALADADGAKFSVLYSFQSAAPNTFASTLGSQPDSRPVLGPDNALYGMTVSGSASGNGVIYRFAPRSLRYTVLHAFGALDMNGDNNDGAIPGVALTLGPDNIFYGMAQLGGANGNGTIFKISASGEFTVLHTFSALDANLHNEDGANPLRTIVIGNDGNLYGTTRVGGENTCGGSDYDTRGCGVMWKMDRWGNNFQVLHQFTASEGHAASVIQACDGRFYGSAVWPATSTPSGVALPSGILFRIAASGQNFQVLYTFSQTDSTGANSDGADPYEPLLEAKPGVFYGSSTYGGTNGNGVVFGFSLSKPDFVNVMHVFGPTTSVNTVTGFSENSDGANPMARLTLGKDGTMYSTASGGGVNGSGTVYSIQPDGDFDLLHTFSAPDPTTGANADGAIPDFGVIFSQDGDLIGAAALGGNGSSAGFFNSGGTLYQIKLSKFGEQ